MYTKKGDVMRKTAIFMILLLVFVPVAYADPFSDFIRGIFGDNTVTGKVISDTPTILHRTVRDCSTGKAVGEEQKIDLKTFREGKYTNYKCKSRYDEQCKTGTTYYDEWCEYEIIEPVPELPVETCGNGIIENGEECDCGSDGVCTEAELNSVTCAGTNYPNKKVSCYPAGSSPQCKFNMQGCNSGYDVCLKNSDCLTGEYCDSQRTAIYDPSYYCRLGEEKSSCTDSDVTSEFPDGKNYYTRGEGKGLYMSDKQTGVIIGEDSNEYSIRYDNSLNYNIYYDYCLHNGSTQLNEAYCDNGLLSSRGYSCPGGCRDGACVGKENLNLPPSVIGVHSDNSPISDIILAAQIHSDLQSIYGEIPQGYTKSFSEIDFSSLDNQVTLLIYNGEAVIIVGSHSPANHLTFAKVITRFLNEENAGYRILSSDQVSVGDLTDLFRLPSSVIAVHDDGPASDTILASKIITSLQSMKNSDGTSKYGDIPSTYTKSFSEIDFSSLDNQVTLLIYNGEAVIIVGSGSNSPIRHLSFAKEITNILEGLSIEYKERVSYNINVNNLIGLFGERSDVIISLPNIAGAPLGSEITIPVIMNSNKGVTSYEVHFTYDTDKLKLRELGVTPGESSLGGGKDFLYDFDDGSSPNKKIIKVMLIGFNGPYTKIGNGELFTLKFDVLLTPTDRDLKISEVIFLGSDIDNELTYEIERTLLSEDLIKAKPFICRYVDSIPMLKKLYNC